MLFRSLYAGLAAVLALSVVGCGCCHSDRSCASPAVVGAAPLVPPPPGPAPCCNGAPGAVATPAYSVPPAPAPVIINGH